MASDVDSLSPYDTNKELFLHTHRNKTGLGYLLYQEGEGPPPPSVPTATETEEEKKFRLRSLGRKTIQVGTAGLTPGKKNW